SYFFLKNKRLNRLLELQKEQLGTALENNNILLKETHHRVKNNLQMISSLLNLQSNQESDTKVLKALAEGKNRIQSVALIHEKLYKNKSLAKIDFKEYIQNLTSHLIRLSVSRVKPEVYLDFEEEIEVNMDNAIPLGLILNELITNSLKHAFTDISSPKIYIKMKVEAGQFVLNYRDNGVGIQGTLENNKDQSLGIKLILMLVRQLKAQINKQDNPWSISINFEPTQITP
ncbi:MAG: sensor histidine kinase, partial [Flavobacteriales bacterium]|nr:sensor histidine kinase [Flavobacteriales bacterium]